MPLIEEILKHAEKDLDITEILRFIVTANPQLLSEIQLPQNSSDENDPSSDKDEVVKFIIKLYNIWISALSGQLCLNVDTSNMGPNTQSKISEFTKEHQFPSMIKPDFPEDFSKDLYKRIRIARRNEIQPLATKPINNHLYNGIARVVADQKDFSGVNFVVKNDSQRIIKIDYMKTFENFKIALNKVCVALNAFLKSSNEDVNVELTTSAPQSPSFFNCLKSRNEKVPYTPLNKTNISINSDPEHNLVENKPDFMQALQAYYQKRLDEQDEHHFWGRLFSCIANPFSLKEKKQAVEKLLYWKNREQGNLPKDEQKDLLNKFTERDIAAIRDHRLGTLSRDYEKDLPQEFRNAEQTIQNNRSAKNQGNEFNIYSRKI